MRLGIIGPGNIAKEFANDLKYVELEKCEVGAVLGHSYEHTKEFVDKYGGSAIKDINELVTNRPDAIYIATPHSLHYEETLFCLENNIPVLCEKPLAINEKQVSKVFIKDKEVTAIRLDPYKETADINEDNQNWPQMPMPSKFQLFKAQSGGARGQSTGGNAMQKLSPQKPTQ